DDARHTRFQCAAFHLTRDGAKPQDGFLCVTSWNNRFVKLRLTTLSGPDTEKQARRFVAAWIPALWSPGARAEPKASAKPAVRRPAPHGRPVRHRRPPPRYYDDD